MPMAISLRKGVSPSFNNHYVPINTQRGVGSHEPLPWQLLQSIKDTLFKLNLSKYISEAGSSLFINLCFSRAYMIKINPYNTAQ